MTILGVIASVLLAAGLIAPYIDIWKRRGRVIGINWVSMTLGFVTWKQLTPIDLSNH